MRTSKQLGDGLRSGLEGRAEQKDHHCSEHRSLATKTVCNGSIDQGSEPSCQEERRHEPAFEAGIGRDAGEVSSEALHGEDA